MTTGSVNKRWVNMLGHQLIKSCSLTIGVEEVCKTVICNKCGQQKTYTYPADYEKKIEICEQCDPEEYYNLYPLRLWYELTRVVEENKGKKRKRRRFK